MIRVREVDSDFPKKWKLFCAAGNGFHTKMRGNPHFDKIIPPLDIIFGDFFLKTTLYDVKKNVEKAISRTD